MTRLPRVNTALVGHADGEYTFERKKAPAKAKVAAKACRWVGRQARGLRRVDGVAALERRAAGEKLP